MFKRISRQSQSYRGMSAECAKDPEELINLAICWKERVLSELKNC